MKKLSTTLKKNRTLNESAIDSRESFFRFGRTEIAVREGIDYSEQGADAILNSIYDRRYPNYVEMLQDLTVLLMTNTQKDLEARKHVAELFTELINNPHVSDYYPKLSKALTLDVNATIECYVHNLAMIAEHLNVSDIDLVPYLSPTMGDTYQPELMDVCTPLHALEVVEGALMLYSYIMANVPRETNLESFQSFYTSILAIYNDYKAQYSAYKYDTDTARDYFKSTLAMRDPSAYLVGDRFNGLVAQSAQPLFIASLMNIFMIAYRNNDVQLNRRIIADRLASFQRAYDDFLDVNNIFQSELFILDNYDYSATRVKQLWQVSQQFASQVKSPASRKAFLYFLNVAKEVADELVIVEARMAGISNII